METVHISRRCALALLTVATLGAAVFAVRGVEHAAAAAPPSQMVFLRFTDGNWQVWQMDENGEGARQLTTSAVDKHSPSWCPGNSVIHFATARGDNILYDLATHTEHPQIPNLPVLKPPRDRHGQELPFDLDVEHLLRAEGFDVFGGVVCGEESERVPWVKEIHVPSAMTDGKGVIVRQELSRELEPVFRIQVQDLMDTPAKGRRKATAGSNLEPAVSKSQVTTFLAHDDGGSELWKSNPRNGTRTPVTDLAGQIRNPVWTHDGRRIIFDSEHEGLRQIYRSRPDGTKLERLTDGKAASHGAVLSWPERRRHSR